MATMRTMSLKRVSINKTATNKIDQDHLVENIRLFRRRECGDLYIKEIRERTIEYREVE